MGYIALSTVGSAGSVLPFVRIGQALRRRGHEVCLISHSHYSRAAAEAGLDFAPIDTPEEFEAFIKDGELFNSPSGFKVVYDRYFLPKVMTEYRLIAERCRPGETVLVARSQPGIAPLLASEKLGIPLVSVFLAPSAFRTLPLFEAFFGQNYLGVVNGFRREIGLPEASRWRCWLSPDQPALGLWADWFDNEAIAARNLVLTGFILASRQSASAGSALHGAVAKMLAEPQKPILMTAGTGLFSGKELFSVCIEACRLLGRKGILVSRFKEQIPTTLPEEIAWASYLPFEALTPDLSAGIHHGGIGTMAQLMAGGVPQLIVGTGVDRPENAAFLKKLGIGDYLPPGQWRAELFSESLRRLLSPEVRAKAQEVARRLSDSDGAELSCRTIEAALLDVGKRRTTAVSGAGQHGRAEHGSDQQEQRVEKMQSLLSKLSPEKRALLELRLSQKRALSGERPNDSIAPLPRQPGENRFPLSSAQQRLWFLEQFEKESHAFYITTGIRLKGNLDFSALRDSLRELIRRHEILRTTFVSNEGQPIQVVHESSEAPLMIVELGAETGGAAARDLDDLIRRESTRRIDIERGPLFRATLIRLDSCENILVLVMHHMVSDAWSMAILIREFAALYRGCVSKTAAPLPEMPIQFADFAVWQRQWLSGKTREKLLSFWKSRLEGAPPLLSLPTDFPRPKRRSYTGKTERHALPTALVERVRTLCEKEKITPFMALLATFKLALFRHTGQSDVIVGTSIANRPRKEAEPLIGFLVNNLPLRSSLAGDPSIRELLRRVQQTTLDAYGHQDFPFEELVQEMQPERESSYSPIFQVAMVLLNTEAETLHLPGIEIAPFPLPNSTSKIDLTFLLTDVNGEIRGFAEYSTELFRQETIVRFLNHWQRLLEELTHDLDRRISTLEMMGEDERSRMLALSGPPSAPPLPDACVHELFEDQAKRCPDAVALCVASEQISFGELNARANRIARHLRRMGVGSDVVVGLCFDRSLEFVVSALGVMKSGGAYLPLNPTDPIERVDFLLKSSGVVVVLTCEQLEKSIPSQGSIVVCVDRDWDRLANCRPANPAWPTASENLVYVIYTSGSTGRPKGVAVSHQAFAAHCRRVQEVYRLGSLDRVLAFAAFTFDASAEQLWPPLLRGARVVLRDSTIWSPEEMARQARRHALTVMNLPTAYWHVVTEAWSKDPEGMRGMALRLMIAGGERMSESAARNWLKTVGQSATLLNAYGPTETTITATVHELSADNGQDHQSIPIGHPLPGRTAYIVDLRGEVAPAGVEGELCLGGESLARGYLGNPGATAERFWPDPFTKVAGARLYRTGDRARLLNNGAIEFDGRSDFQVKIRGFRIEPGEIETLLRSHPRVHDSVVLVSDPDRDGRGQEGQKVLELLGTGDANPEALLEALQLLPPDTAEDMLAQSEDLDDFQTFKAYAMESDMHESSYRQSSGLEVLLKYEKSSLLNSLREAQRNWLVQRSLDELLDDLKHLETISGRWVRGGDRAPIQAAWDKAPAEFRSDQLVIGRQQVMHEWTRPIMRVMADAVTESHGDVLEVGFGMGISARYIQERGVRSHTIIEANEEVIQACERWKSEVMDRDIRLIRGKCQDVAAQLGQYDGVFFDTYPSSEEEFKRYVLESTTFAEHFFPMAAGCLRPGGVFTYYTNEIDTFSRRHQRLVFKYFKSLSLQVVSDLRPPEDCPIWWADSMVVVTAVK